MEDKHTDIPATREYHYVLSLYAHGRQITASSIEHVAPGETRQDVFLRVFNRHTEGTAMDRPTVMFWSLEPNELPGFTVGCEEEDR